MTLIYGCSVMSAIRKRQLEIEVIGLDQKLILPVFPLTLIIIGIRRFK